MIEMDRHGRVLLPEVLEVGQLYPPDLLLGLPPAAMLDQHISVVLPELANRSIADLFVAGALGQVAVAGALASGARPEVKRSAMKTHAGRCVWAGQLTHTWNQRSAAT